MAAGVLSGYITAFLQTRLGVESILAGIIVNTGLYTINLMAMGFSSTLSVFKCDTIFSLAKSALSGVLGGALAGWSKLLVGAVHLRFPYGAFRRGAGAVSEELRY